MMGRFMSPIYTSEGTVDELSPAILRVAPDLVTKMLIDAFIENRRAISLSLEDYLRGGKDFYTIGYVFLLALLLK